MITTNNLQEIFEGALYNWLNGLENWCRIFNKVFTLMFTYLKYITVIILVLGGIMVILKSKNKNTLNDDSYQPQKDIKRKSIFIGVTLIIIALGFLVNLLTLILIELLDPLPDRFIFEFINFSGGVDPSYLNRIQDVEASKFPHEKTIYYCIAFVSFSAFFQLFFGVIILIKKGLDIGDPKKMFLLLISGLIEGILCGFSTWLPFFL